MLTIPGSVAYAAEQFGEVRTTGWGTVFDVRAVADANSVAYTNLPLVTHTDEAYRDPAPPSSSQHFLLADAEGGETTLVDGFKVAADLRAERPDLFGCSPRSRCTSTSATTTTSTSTTPR